MNSSIIISGTGSYVPEKILTNADLEKIVDTSDEWIFTRTGIRQRHIAKENESSSCMGYEAAKKAIENAGLTPEDIDLLVVATVTPDSAFPSTACRMQAKLGLRKEIPCFDIEAACTGFIYSIEVASAMMLARNYYKHALVIGADKLTSITNWKDRNTCVLFGDASAGVVLSKVDTAGVGIISTRLGADGSEPEKLNVIAGGSAKPSTPETIENGENCIYMDGKHVFKHAVKIMEAKALEVLSDCGVKPEDVKILIPHQANARIIESLAKRLKLPEKVYMNISKYGNTSAASIPLALDDACKEGKIKSGDYVLLVGFGGGLTWGSSLIKWH